MRLNQGRFVLLYFALFAFFVLYLVCMFCTISISQVIGCEDRRRNDLDCVWSYSLQLQQITPTEEKCCTTNSSKCNSLPITSFLFDLVTVFHRTVSTLYVVTSYALTRLNRIKRCCCLHIFVFRQFYIAEFRNFLERTPYQYINIRRDWSGKVVNGEGGLDETTVIRTRYQGKCRKFGTDSLEGQYRWFTSPRKTQKTMDG